MCTLKSLVLTCSSFYHAYTGAEVLIARHVLLNEVEFNVLLKAVAAFRPRIQEFVLEHLHSRGPPRQEWTLSEARFMSEFYHHVNVLRQILHPNRWSRQPSRRIRILTSETITK
jgi:hypothetical protein